MEKESALTEMEKQNHKHGADPFSGEDLVSPMKKAKKSEDTGCDTSEGLARDPKLPSSAEDEKQEIPAGGEVTSCIGEEKKEFLVEAHVAEDRGGRHTMEDVWVVLPDASLDLPGKLR